MNTGDIVLDIIKVTEYLSLIKYSDNPLSANVFIIKGKEANYIFDVGSNKEVAKYIFSLSNKKIIISHFHPDHFNNISFLSIDKENLYLGDFTYKKYGYGNVVNDYFEINDDINIKIIHIPNSHAKGSLCVIINDLYLLIGDSLCGNINGFNVSLLKEEIDLLKRYDFKYVIDSHSIEIKLKNDIILMLDEIYKRREKNKPYISYDNLE